MHHFQSTYPKHSNEPERHMADASDEYQQQQRGPQNMISAACVLTSGARVLISGTRALISGTRVLISRPPVLISGGRVLIGGTRVFISGAVYS